MSSEYFNDRLHWCFTKPTLGTGRYTTITHMIQHKLYTKSADSH